MTTATAFESEMTQHELTEAQGKIKSIWNAYCVCVSNGGLGGVARRHLEPAIYAAMKSLNANVKKPATPAAGTPDPPRSPASLRFTITHNAQNKPLPEPVTVSVTPESRTDYINPCACKFVFVVAPTSVEKLVEKRLVLENNVPERCVVCACLGVLEERTPALYIPPITRPIAFIDIESTGTDPVTDRIIEFAAVVLMPDGSRRRFCQRFNPEMPIPAGASEVHGIYDADVADCPTFKQWAPRIMAALAGKDIGGYNLRRMDLPMLDEEARRANCKLDISGIQILDAFGVFQKREPRNLEAAVSRYCGRSHEDAHGALPDAEGSLDVWLAQLSEYDDLRAMSLEEQAAYCLHGDGDRLPCDLAGKLYLKDGEVYFAFGKAKDKRVADDVGYANWILGCFDPPFPGSTREALQAELDRIGYGTSRRFVGQGK